MTIAVPGLVEVHNLDIRRAPAYFAQCSEVCTTPCVYVVSFTQGPSVLLPLLVDEAELMQQHALRFAPTWEAYVLLHFL